MSTRAPCRLDTLTSTIARGSKGLPHDQIPLHPLFTHLLARNLCILQCTCTLFRVPQPVTFDPRRLRTRAAALAGNRFHTFVLIEKTEPAVRQKTSSDSEWCHFGSPLDDNRDREACASV
jgi:hypothetical protein